MINRFFNFLNASPVNFLACHEIERQLLDAGYKKIDPQKRMNKFVPGDRVFVTKNDSSVYAFHIGSTPLCDAGFRMICAHCDSPTFRIKPVPESVAAKHIVKLDVELYGGAIINTWFDRPLSIAGRVIVNEGDSIKPVSKLVHIKRPLLTIPNLCIHFNRQMNNGVSVSVQKDVQPILCTIAEGLQANNMLLTLIAGECNINIHDIIDFDLFLYDTTAPCTFGMNNEFISAGRLDDLEMVFAGLTALLHSSDTPEITKVLAVFDNEETGSQTKQGAGSPFLASIIQRMVLAQGGSLDDYFRAVENAFMISADNAHAYHPNYKDKYDPLCYPKLGYGPAIKYNAAQKYTSDAMSAAIFANICKKAGVDCQKFVNHGDVAGGSTLGNILTSNMPIHGVDMGCPILAMHSVRETGSVKDLDDSINAFQTFYEM